MKQIEVADLVKVIWQWLWLIVVLFIAIVGFLFFHLRNSDDKYEAEVTLSVSTPDREDVAAISEYTSTNDRDLITTAINSFVEIAQYDEVKNRTQEALGITDDYQITAEAKLGADFIYITVQANQKELAQQIAQAHTENAIAYFGELRILPATQALAFFSAELAEAKQALIDTQKALLDFHLEHGIIDLETEITIAERVLEGLELTYAELLLPSANTSLSLVPSQTDLLNARNSIETQRLRIAELSQLRPEYSLLTNDLSSAQANYNTLLANMAETKLRQSFAGQAMFIQIIKRAALPTSPVNSTTQTLILGGVASLVLGISLAFFLEYLKGNW